MKPREYCCCAIPLVNPGIYATLTEQFVLGVVVGTLSVATPSRAAVQVFGFLGVAQVHKSRHCLVGR
ncbi:hypothetical protein ID866_4788 [Astraeus odoratus]|nr:hypothetical protein ID866_4788 [Astraeus odoratus]